MNIPPKYEDVVAQLDAAQTEIKCLKAVLNGMEFKQVDDMVLDGVDACLFLGQESARIIKGIQAERNGLREELESIKASVDGYDSPEHAAQVADEMGHQCDALQQRLTIAEQDNDSLRSQIGREKRIFDMAADELVKDAARYRWLMSGAVMNGTLGIDGGWIDFEFKDEAAQQIDEAMQQDALKPAADAKSSPPCPNCKVCIGSPDFPESCLINGVKT